MKMWQRVPPLLWQGMLCGVLIDLLFVSISVVRYPVLLYPGQAGTTISVLVLLLVYGCIGVGLPLRARSIQMKSLLWRGTIMGMFVGIIFVIDITVENFLDLSQGGSTFSTLGFMALVFLAFGIAGAWGAYRTEPWFLGILSSVWSAIQGTLIALFFGFLINFLFGARLEQILVTDYARSGMHDLRAFTFFNTMDSASSHLLEAPILAAIFGALGALISKGMHPLRGRSLREAS